MAYGWQPAHVPKELPEIITFAIDSNPTASAQKAERKEKANDTFMNVFHLNNLPRDQRDPILFNLLYEALKTFTHADEFATQMLKVKSLFLARLKSNNPTTVSEFVHNIVLAIISFERSVSHAQWQEDIANCMSKFVRLQVRVLEICLIFQQEDTHLYRFIFSSQINVFQILSLDTSNDSSIYKKSFKSTIIKRVDLNSR